MNVKRIVIATVFAASVAVGGAACGNSEPTRADKIEKAEEEIVDHFESAADEFNEWSSEVSETEAWKTAQRGDNDCELAAAADELRTEHPAPPTGAEEYATALDDAYALFSKSCATGVEDADKAQTMLDSFDLFYTVVDIETAGYGDLENFGGYESAY